MTRDLIDTSSEFECRGRESYQPLDPVGSTATCTLVQSNMDPSLGPLDRIVIAFTTEFGAGKASWPLRRRDSNCEVGGAFDRCHFRRAFAFRAISPGRSSRHAMDPGRGVHDGNE